MTDSELTYDTESSSSVASIQYTYHGIPVGSATVDLAEGEAENTFDFENQNQMESQADTEGATEEESRDAGDKVIFVNAQTGNCLDYRHRRILHLTVRCKSSGR